MPLKSRMKILKVTFESITRTIFIDRILIKCLFVSCTFNLSEMDQNIENLKSIEDIEKTWKIESILSEKGEVLKRLNPPRCFVYRHSGVFHIFSKK